MYTPEARHTYEIEDANGPATITVEIDHYRGVQPDGWPDERYKVRAVDANTGRVVRRAKVYRGETAYNKMDADFRDLHFMYSRLERW